MNIIISRNIDITRKKIVA